MGPRLMSSVNQNMDFYSKKKYIFKLGIAQQVFKNSLNKKMSKQISKINKIINSFLQNRQQIMKKTNKFHPIMFIIAVLCVSIVHNYFISLQSLPVNTLLIYQSQIRLNRLLRYLNMKEEKIDKLQLYARVKNCELYLEDISRQLRIKYENSVIGEGSTVKGQNNIILGDQNKLQGYKNWIFTRSYQGRNIRVLVIDKWKIFLDRIQSIKIDPKIAVVKCKDQSIN